MKGDDTADNGDTMLAVFDAGALLVSRGGGPLKKLSKKMNKVASDQSTVLAGPRKVAR